MKKRNKYVIRLEKALVENEYSFRYFYLRFYQKYSKKCYSEFIDEINWIYSTENFLPEPHHLAFADFEREILKSC
jgi:hypothetical protein